MTSTAYSAQGTTIKVATGTGSAKSITGIAVGSPTIITSAAHGLNNGDVVTLSGLTGTDAATLNGLTVVVTNKTTNTFAVAVDTTGKTITASGIATPVTFTKIANVKSFNGLDGSASEIDVTNLDSTAKENRAGLSDPGQFVLEVEADESDAGQQAVLAAYQSVPPQIKQYQVNLPNGKTVTFNAWVKKFSRQGGVDAVVKGSIDLRITGPYTIA